MFMKTVNTFDAGSYVTPSIFLMDLLEENIIAASSPEVSTTPIDAWQEGNVNFI